MSGRFLYVFHQRHGHRLLLVVCLSAWDDRKMSLHVGSWSRIFRAVCAVFQHEYFSLFLLHRAVLLDRLTTLHSLADRGERTSLGQ